MSNRFALRRLLEIIAILLVVSVILNMGEAALRSWLGYPYPGPIIGAAIGLLAVYLLLRWRVPPAASGQQDEDRQPPTSG